MTQHIITRDSILNGTMSQLVKLSDDEISVMSPQERQMILDQVLGQNSKKNGIWLFAYGSLIWNPAFDYAERKVGIVYGYHRSFCLWATIGRGTKDMPGLMLGLKQGGSCKGIFYRISANKTRTELDIVFRRELITSAYRPTWVRAHIKNRFSSKALTFVMNQNHDKYAGRLDKETIIDAIATAQGPLGSCSDYLYETVTQLDEHGIPDQNMAALAQEVRRRKSF